MSRNEKKIMSTFIKKPASFLKRGRHIKKRAIKLPVAILVCALLVIGGGITAYKAMAIVTVAPASGGTNISIDTTSAAEGTGVFQTLSGPAITEAAPGDIAQGTHTFTLPSGWEFDISSTVTVIRTAGDIEPESQVITPGSGSFTFEITQASTESSGLAFVVDSMKVRPTGTIAPTTGEITHSGAMIAGVENNVTSFGTLTTVAGAPTQLIIEDQNDGTSAVISAQNIVSGNLITAYSIERDQFGNFIENADAIWSLTYKTGGVVDDDLVSAVGSATFTGNLVGTAIIHAEADSFTADSGVLTVVPGAVNVDISTLTVDNTTEIVSNGSNVITATVTAKDTAGNVIPNATVELLVTGDDNAITPYPSSTTNTSGIAEFTISSTKAEEKTISATIDSVLIDKTQNITFTHDVAFKLGIQTQPSATAVAGDAFVQQPVINILDQFGNLVIDSTAEITAVKAGGSDPVLLGTLIINAVNGVATFSNLFYEEATIIKIDFTAIGLILAISGDIAVSPASPATVTFQTQPATASGDTVDNILTTQPIVKVVDTYGNNVVDGTDVILSKATGNGALQGTLTQATTNGLATFSDIGYSGIDTFTITATVGSISVTSNLVGSLNAGVITEFTISADSPQIAGIAFDVNVSNAVDQFENFASGIVEISASSGNGNSPSGATPTFGDITVSGGAGSADTTLVNAVSTVLQGQVGSIIKNTNSIIVSSADPSQVVLTNSKSPIDADGSDSSTITGQLKDEFENNAPVSGVSIVITTDKGVITQSDPNNTDTSGQVSGILTSGDDRTAGTANIGATVVVLSVVGTTVEFNDVTAPDAPTISDYTSSVVINSGNKASQVIAGTAEVDSTVEIYVDGIATLETTVTDNDGKFAFTNTQLQAADIVSGADYSTAKVVTLTATDIYSNESLVSSSISYTQDTFLPTFTIQYYSDTDLLASLGDNPSLKVGIYYIQITSNEALNGTPIISIDAEGVANDVTDGATTLDSGDSYKYIREIAIDLSAIGVVLENISITGTDLACNVATNVDPTDEATKAAYTDTTDPSVSSYTLNGESASVAFDPNDPASVNIVLNANEDVKFNRIGIINSSNNEVRYFTQSINYNSTVAKDWDGKDKATDGVIVLDDEYTIKVTMKDRAGNENIVSLTTHTITVDTVPPTVSITSPQENDIVVGDLTIIASVTDASSCSYKFDGGNELDINCSGDNVPTSGLSEGYHTLNFYGKDNAGNTAFDSVNFIVNNDKILTVDDTSATKPDFATIQAAIDAATPGDMISVKAGEYTEQINIDKSLTLTGAGQDNTHIISPDPMTMVIYDQFGSKSDTPRYIVHRGTNIPLVRIASSDVTFEGFHVDLNNQKFWDVTGSFAIDTTYSKGVGILVDHVETTPATPDEFTGIIIQTNKVDGLLWDDYSDCIKVLAQATVNINNNILYGYGESAVSAQGMDTPRAAFYPTVTANSNTMYGGSDAREDYNYFFGIGYWSGATGLADGNTIYNAPNDNGYALNSWTPNPVSFTNNIIITDDGAVGGYGAQLYESSNLIFSGNNIQDQSIAGVIWLNPTITIMNNIVTNCIDGFAGDDLTSGSVTLYYNSFSGTADGHYAVDMDGHVSFEGEVITPSTITADAVDNWWGNESGPKHESNPSGTGGEVSDNVDFRPWCTESTCTTEDNINPTVIISSSETSPTNISPIPVTVEFIEAVTNFEVGDITITNGSGVLTGSGANYNLAVTPSGQGEITVNIAAGVAWDLAGNYNTAADQFSIDYDSEAPVKPAISATDPINIANPTMTISGTGEPNTIVSYSIVDAGTGLVAGTGNVDENGNFNITDINVSSLDDGTLTVSVTLTDAADNTSEPDEVEVNKDMDAPTFEIAYYADSGLTILADDYIKAGTYYIKIISNEALSGVPTVSIGAEGINNDVSDESTVSLGGNDYKYERIIVFDEAAVGVDIEEITVEGIDVAGNMGTEVKDGRYTDTIAPNIINLMPTYIIPDAKSPISADFSEAGSGVDVGSIKIVIDNEDETAYVLDIYKTESGVIYKTEDIIGALAEGKHYVTVEVADNLGNSSSVSWDFRVNSIYNPDPICTELQDDQWTCDISLNQGWNLISSPVVVNSTPVSVFSEINNNIEIVKYYDSGSWLSYIPELTSENTLTTIEDGQGYWINMDVADTLTITGLAGSSAIVDDLPTMPQSPYSLNDGWNLIGFRSVIDKTVNDYVSSHISNAGDNYYIWKVNGLDYSMLYPSDSMTSGNGYWLLK